MCGIVSRKPFRDRARPRRATRGDPDRDRRGHVLPDRLAIHAQAGRDLALPATGPRSRSHPSRRTFSSPSSLPGPLIRNGAHSRLRGPAPRHAGELRERRPGEYVSDNPSDLGKFTSADRHGACRANCSILSLGLQCHAPVGSRVVVVVESGFDPVARGDRDRGDPSLIRLQLESPFLRCPIHGIIQS
jgi:hypothetical protein